jgi:hypothetical protein
MIISLSNTVKRELKKVPKTSKEISFLIFYVKYFPSFRKEKDQNILLKT